MTINARLNDVAFKTLCATAYTAAELQDMAPCPCKTQFTQDRANLLVLSKKYDVHHAAYWGQAGGNAGGRFRALGKMASAMCRNLENTGGAFIRLPTLTLPLSLLIEMQRRPVPSDDDDPVCCSNPFAGDDPLETHVDMADAFNRISDALTPNTGELESFLAYRRTGNWQQRWINFSEQYGGRQLHSGEFSANCERLQSDWNKIEMGRDFFRWQDSWKPGPSGFRSPLSWEHTLATGWASFQTICLAVAHSELLKPTLPGWSSTMFMDVRKRLADSFTLIPAMWECGRPKWENLVAPGAELSRTLYGHCLPRFINCARSIARGFLGLLSVPAWGVKLLFKNVLGNLGILLTNVLFNSVLGALWLLSWPGQGIRALADCAWQFSKCILYPVSKLAGVLSSVAAYAGAALGYLLVAGTAWLAKSAFQCTRFVLQNLATVCWNYLGRPVVWTMAKIGIVLKTVAATFYTGVKAFLHAVGMGMAQASSLIGVGLYCFFLRPAAVFSAKSALRFSQVLGHAGLAALQLLRAVAIVPWHFILKPFMCAVQRIALNFGHVPKIFWNKVLLPALYYGVFTPLKFVAEKALLFVAGVLQVVAYPVVLVGGAITVGTAFALSEFALWAERHWISKSPFFLESFLRSREIQFSSSFSEAGL